jgi:CysZ protein
MRVIVDHVQVMVRCMQLIVQGKFLVYFLPGVLISILFLYYMQSVKSVGGYLDVVAYVPWVGDYLQSGVTTLLSWIEGISIFVFQFVLITVLSPVHTILSEKLDRHETQRNFKAGWEKIINDIVRTIGIAILGGLMYLFSKLIFSVLFWLIGLSALTPYISIVLIAFFTGFNSYDFSLERYDYSVAKSWGYAFKHPLYMICTGLIFTGFLAIPFIGVVIAPVFLTMVGTLNFLRIQTREQ